MTEVVLVRQDAEMTTRLTPSFVQRFVQIAQASPEAVAIYLHGKPAYTYKRLHEEAWKLAGELKRRRRWARDTSRSLGREVAGIYRLFVGDLVCPGCLRAY